MRIYLVECMCACACLQEDPYMMRREDPNGMLTGNDRYEGYCVDLLRGIANILHFNYSIKEVGDGKYGSMEGPQNEWTGMVRELMDKVGYHGQRADGQGRLSWSES